MKLFIQQLGLHHVGDASGQQTFLADKIIAKIKEKHVIGDFHGMRDAFSMV